MTLHTIGTADARGTGPVLVLLHGYGSNEQDLPGIAGRVAPRLPWLSLRAPTPVMNGGFAWFPIERLEDPDPALIDQATVAAWDAIDARLPADAPVVTLGFSQGGLMATQLLRTRPERVVGTVVLSGFVLAEPQPADARVAELRPPVFWGRGEQDVVIPPVAVARASTWFGEHVSLDEHRYAGLGHAVSEAELHDIAAYLDRVLAPA